MGNPTYEGSSNSSSGSDSSQSSNLTRETSRSETIPVRHKKNFSSQAFAWMTGGSTNGTELRKTTTTILEPTGRTVIHQGRPVQLHSAKTTETMAWVRRPGADVKNGAASHPPRPRGSTRNGSSRPSGGTRRPDPPRKPRQPGHGSRTGPAAKKSSQRPPPPPHMPAFDLNPPRAGGPPPPPRAPAVEPTPPPRAGGPPPPPQQPAFRWTPPQGRGPAPAQRRNPY